MAAESTDRDGRAALVGQAERAGQVAHAESAERRRVLVGLSVLAGALAAPRTAAAQRSTASAGVPGSDRPAGADAARVQPGPGLLAAARRLASGPHVLMIRHAETEPGVGDPPGYRLDDCATQRNLSAAGRMQARRLGEAMRAAGLLVGEVRASVWCRCRDTADLAFGRHQVWPALNSFFDERDGQAAQTAAVRAFIAAHRGAVMPVLVTHQVNISAVSGTGVAMGHVVALPADGGPVFGFDPLG
jgi:phosphohistidine phosphatase SixA